ncbi:hypothetical protein [Streptomyces sp. TLI_146]|uniref:hypothetical protein n=1 Tax=Streptomyces sp. TLI_146 TaxID=1938858 RepID=UPI00117F8C71|nr:hypothetical protein [Streptomyces sp. TLI_146]
MKAKRGVLAALTVALLAVGPLGATAAAHSAAYPVAQGPAPSVSGLPTAAPPPAGSRIAYDPKAVPGSWTNPIIAKERTGLASNCQDRGFYWCKVWNGGPGWFKLGTFLASGSHEYAMTQGISDHYYEVYMDRSWDHGANWEGRINVVTNELRWSDSIYDGPPNVTRACLWDMTDVVLYCSPWH